MIRIIHYLNQFFGGIGGEDKADISPRIIEGPIGPGRLIETFMDKEAKVIATVICGDNYFAQDIEKASSEVLKLILPYRADLFIAGPAFNAGRYGIACGAVCKIVQKELGIPAVTGMYDENPGVELYRTDTFIIKTTDSARGMSEALQRILSLGRRLVRNEKIGPPSKEGYFSRGILINEYADRIGAERVVDMLMLKLKGMPFESEVSRPIYDRIKPAPSIKDLRLSKIALVTDGGLVPKGNPDRIEISSATRFGRYDIKGLEKLKPEDYEVRHSGYDSTLVREDPNRLVPLDVMRDFEKEGRIGGLHDKFYSTTGVASIVEIMRRLGRIIASELLADGVSGVILTST